MPLALKKSIGGKLLSACPFLWPYIFGTEHARVLKFRMFSMKNSSDMYFLLIIPLFKVMSPRKHEMQIFLEPFELET